MSLAERLQATRPTDIGVPGPTPFDMARAFRAVRSDPLTFLSEVTERHGASFQQWLGDLEYAPPGGESFRAVEERVLAGLERLLAAYAGKTVLVVSHVTPIKTLVAHAMGADLSAVFAMELSPASVSVLSFYPDSSAPLGRRGSLRLFNAIAPGSRSLVDNGRW